MTDTAERFGSLADVARFVAAPQRVVDDPPARNLAQWDRLTARRPVVALGGIDAHQIGRRIAGRVPLRLMSYARSFRHMRTHVLLDAPVTGDVDADVAAIYAALRGGPLLPGDRLARARPRVLVRRRRGERWARRRRSATATSCWPACRGPRR